ncbi:NADH-quinone oxidoreductase subunit L [bacterium HR29]|jgi:NADH-quinone oxidoreductase subunit L|nr:NADH-quinone oxidoreductase subunit L [bacterium HR29]
MGVFLAAEPSVPATPEWLLWAVLVVPVVSFAAIALGVRKAPRLAGHLTQGAVLASFALSVVALLDVVAADGGVAIFRHEWFTAGPLSVELGVRLDGLSAVMLVVVTSVSFLVQVYSQGYMAGDPGYGRYYAYMSLFTAAMLGLVLADNLFMLFIFWELVGLASYLLIGFWFHRPSAAAAAKKAFITTRIGDLGLLAAMLLIWTRGGTFAIDEIHELALTGALSGTTITLFGLGIFAGAAGKSAQFPLHVWLPDAMEGPTPVSALIHAATMVAAGVYLVARFFPVFEVSTDARDVVAWLGAVTAIMAATIALVQTDLKRVLAYSTISQLGYMMLALGVLGYVAAVFHLFTHAFFKALLFLGSGSVNHATNTFDMRKMGGLRKAMPVTFWTFLVGSLALAGVFPFAGFWSKDEILRDAWHENRTLWAIGLGAAFLTAFYMFRAIFLTFFGEYRGGEPPAHGHDDDAHGHLIDPAHPHESPLVMTAPLVVLAVMSVVAGVFNMSGVTDGFGRIVSGALPEAEHHAASFEWGIALSSLGVAAAGILVAWAVYHRRVIASSTLRSAFLPIALVLEQKYFMDHLYEGLLVRRLFYGGVCRGFELFDRYVVDGAVNGTGSAVRWAGDRLRMIQTGEAQAYGAAIVGGVVVIVVSVLLANPS